MNSVQSQMKLVQKEGNSRKWVEPFSEFCFWKSKKENWEQESQLGKANHLSPNKSTRRSAGTDLKVAQKAVRDAARCLLKGTVQYTDALSPWTQKAKALWQRERIEEALKKLCQPHRARIQGAFAAAAWSVQGRGRAVLEPKFWRKDAASAWIKSELRFSGSIRRGYLPAAQCGFQMAGHRSEGGAARRLRSEALYFPTGLFSLWVGVWSR